MSCYGGIFYNIASTSNIFNLSPNFGSLCHFQLLLLQKYCQNTQSQTKIILYKVNQFLSISGLLPVFQEQLFIRSILSPRFCQCKKSIYQMPCQNLTFIHKYLKVSCVNKCFLKAKVCNILWFQIQLQIDSDRIKNRVIGSSFVIIFMKRRKRVLFSSFLEDS